MAMTYQHVQIYIDTESILWMTIDRKDSLVNTLSREVLEELARVIKAIQANSALKGVIIGSNKPTGFIAGADIESFTRLKDEKEAYELVRQAQQLFEELAALQVPTVAMIEGFCLGGGLELALACNYRIANYDKPAQIGLPEVKLGIHPGWGGSVRLVRLLGVLKALPLMVQGRILDAKQAARLKVIDEAVPERMLRRAARYYVLNRPKEHTPCVWQRLLNAKLFRQPVAYLFYKKLRAKVNKAHYPAPYALVDNWEKNGAMGAVAYEQEAQSISRLFLHSTSQHLVRVFFLQTRMKGLAKQSRFNANHVHVIGAGVMGGDIAAWCALQGCTVTLQDRSAEAIAPAMQRAYSLFKKQFKRDRRLLLAAWERLTPDSEGLGVKQADVVIEAIFENKKAKQDLYRAIEGQMKPEAILATNTSTLPLDELSQGLKRPERLVGLHFFNPVAKMQLVEVISTTKTDTIVVANALAFVRQIHRLPLPVKSAPGFLVNRILLPYLLEAVRLVEEGVPAPLVDRAATEFGMPLGPIELADTVGLDICLSAGTLLTQHLGGDLPKRLQVMVDKGRLGRKSGQGFYRYRGGKAVKPSIDQNATLSDDVTDRLILSMVNESVACLKEKIVEDSDWLDAGMIFGAGFAPFRGGPMTYLKDRGWSDIKKILLRFKEHYGERFSPKGDI